ncbi:MAP kinase kinase Wis1 [Tilletia horrida]|uniref:mitogen-activated protein kinase kinase n=1 Tax=Tilletia horrida TaxID=155126 RepID=A0AAN6JLF4_9BASI|nr:MAP kinase kinase Wis1 [Tilletia horrida]KAK0536174.1 MAP kinase kinase Wis1 [Tilletia horrida]KAK0539701.1 MAP kinase kinase Wis1 [Tilletia horrida]KAK0564701.1 MAP kinase kinase Wis1 [Tilletia horrida]
MAAVPPSSADPSTGLSLDSLSLSGNDGAPAHSSAAADTGAGGAQVPTGTTAAAPTARPSPVRPPGVEAAAASAAAASATASSSPPAAGAGAGTSAPALSRQSLANTTRQLAATPLPPSLRAKMLASAQRAASASPTASSPSPGPPGTMGGAVLGHDQRIDTARLLGAGPGKIGNVGGGLPGSGAGGAGLAGGAGGNTLARGFGAVPGAGFPNPNASPVRLPPGFAPPQANGAAAAGGLGGPGNAARRGRPSLRLSDVYGPNGEGGPGAAAAANGTTDTTGGFLAVSSTGSHPGFSAARGAPPAGGLGRRMGPPGKLNTGPTTTSGGTPFANFSKIVDPSGRLKFDGKAILHASGVQFQNGTSFKINMEELELQDELGKGNYGTVRRVKHRVTNVEMAMKEIRLELDDSKLNAIIMELDILHRATAPQIVEFYGAFFIESCVYYTMEYMDAGSLDKLYDGRGSVPEDVLARITSSMVKGLRFLKDELQIMHRDVKPTNVLVNRKGQVKLCDFGVSGQLEKSLAKTNIGCQSYMAPERIQGESQFKLGTYTVASDVWSLGLSMVEITIGTYPYPPETYANVFAQLQAIVHGDPPQLPPDLYSETARDFVGRCLEKVPSRRATYAEMLEHPFLRGDVERGEGGVDMQGWVEAALQRRAERRRDLMSSIGSPQSAPPAAAMTPLAAEAEVAAAAGAHQGPEVVVEPPTPVLAVDPTGLPAPPLSAPPP